MPEWLKGLVLKTSKGFSLRGFESHPIRHFFFNMDKSKINKQIVIENYSARNSVLYDDNTNKNFLYGEATKKFIKNIKLSNKDNIIADIGCGTGYVFELISKKYKKKILSFTE